MNRPNKIIPCPACSSLVTMHPAPDCGWWGVCPACDGMIGDRVLPHAKTARLGPLVEWDEGNDMSNPATCRYFDVTVNWGSGSRNTRSHGWYNPVTGKLVQLG
jgi:hypothetical protein